MPRTKQVIKLITDNLEISSSNVTAEHNLIDDLGADSLGVVEIVMEIEDQFNVIIPEEAIEKFHTIEDIVSWLDINT